MVQIVLLSRCLPVRHPGLFWLFSLLCCLVLLGGCGSKQPVQESPGASWRLPHDDGTSPLTPTELAALESIGELDKNLPPQAMEAVAREYRHFLRKGRRTMSSFSQRSEQYLAYARKVFRSRGMPEELACLAIVESGYRTDALSHAGAAGAWQFMPYTGKKYGLEQDWWLDERLDAYAATEAAASYLQKLYDDFNDWPTAIAAYNAGEGKMRRAMQGVGGKNFFEVSARNHLLDEKTQLRNETLQYVPRFLAVTKIMRNLPQLGFEPIEPEDAPEVVRMPVKPGTELQAVARAVGLSSEEFDRYNSHHKRPITCTNRITHINLPEHAAKSGKEYLHSSHAGQYAGWHVAKVTTSADSWQKISRRSQVPVERLKAMNPGKEKLKAGHMVLVPRSVNMSKQAVNSHGAAPRKARAEAKPGQKEKNTRTKAAQATQTGRTHKLKADETLYAVARRYGVSLKQLQKVNDITDPAKVRAGRVLLIPNGKKTVAEQGPARAGASGQLGTRQRESRAAKHKTTYTVRASDSLWNIARKHNVSVEDLKRWNGVDEKSLRPGAVLVIGMR